MRRKIAGKGLGRGTATEGAIDHVKHGEPLFALEAMVGDEHGEERGQTQVEDAGGIASADSDGGSAGNKSFNVIPAKGLCFRTSAN